MYRRRDPAYLGLRVRVRDRLRVVAGSRGWTRARVRVRGLDGAHI